MDLQVKGEVDLSWLITHRFAFDEAPAGYELYASRDDGLIKLVLDI